MRAAESFCSARRCFRHCLCIGLADIRNRAKRPRKRWHRNQRCKITTLLTTFSYLSWAKDHRVDCRMYTMELSFCLQTHMAWCFLVQTEWPMHQSVAAADSVGVLGTK